MKRKEKIVGALAILVISIIALTVGYFSRSSVEDEEVFVPLERTIEEVADTDTKEKVSETIVVDIKGAIKNPKEYTLKVGARVRDLIEMAGGLTEEADENKIYYSKILKDEECIRIFKIGEEVEEVQGDQIASEGASTNVKSSGKLNINKASLEELQTLPGIGEVRAKSIIEYREAQGGFKSVEELGNISGIGAKTLEKLRDKVDIKWGLS